MVNVIRRQMTKVCFQNRYFGLAMESRQTVAHGFTLVITHIFLVLE